MLPDHTELLTHIKEPNLDDRVIDYMNRDVARLNVDHTVGQALEHLRAHPPTTRIIYFYVVDQDDRLEGVVPTRRLLLSPPERPLREIMVPRVVAIPDTATVGEACEFFVLHRHLAFPVVDQQQRLIGSVDVELFTDELELIEERERKDDLFQLIGVHMTRGHKTQPLAAFRSRFPWLLCNVAGGVAAAFLSGVFEAELQRVVELALFIPVVLALAESVAIQSLTLSLQLMEGRTPRWRDIFVGLRDEVGTGMLLGLATGMVVAGVALAWLRRVPLMVCLLIGIAGGVTCAAVVGMALPTVLRRLNRDPQVAAGPIALVSADMITLLLYFSAARWMFG
jgi:magnesium transporter